MCGIAGKIDFRGSVDEELVDRMCGVIAHRGPDSRGTYVRDGVGLGIQRLAIIDVAGGDQPIFNEDRTVVVVMNGEIYNFPALREQLLARGHRFSSHSDTEVLVHLYEDHGDQMVHHLRGMFAFAIWDARRRRLFCARDRVGKKPFFWARQGSRVWFGSEIRAILQDREVDRAVDPSAISAYLGLMYVPDPLSAFQSIRKLPPASTLTVDESGERIETYWSLDYRNKSTGSQPELEERLRELVEEATRIRLMSEVPLGAFLSGGIDSSIVVATMAKQMAEPVKTFSIGFHDSDFDELVYARAIAERFSTDHHEFVVEPRALELIPQLARHYGEPFADPSAIPSFYLAELTRRHVTVALNGDGGDESFAGYGRYATDADVNHLEWLPGPLLRATALGRLIGEGRTETSIRTKLNRIGRIVAMSPAERYALRITAFDHRRQRRLLSREFASRIGDRRPEDYILQAWRACAADEVVDCMLGTDVRMYLPGHPLTKMDIASMAYSVEARSPLLDHRVMEFAASLPVELKLRQGDGKRLLKSAYREILPAEILDRRKMGFGVPIARWFREEFRDLPAEVLLDRQAIDRGYFQPREIERLIEEHHEGSTNHATRLWVLLQLEFWHREVVEAPIVAAPAVTDTPGDRANGRGARPSIGSLPRGAG